MGVHPDGSGTSWDDLEAVDVDQPHGLDYRYANHIAKAVRKRLDKEHKEFGDSTAGGEHKPGGCAILDIVDQSVDISIDDSTYKGRNLIYDQTNSVFWCFTNTDGTASTPDGYKLMIGPKSICLGADFTWDGAHLFDASVDMSDAAITGDLTIAGKLVVDGSADFSDVFVAGDLSIAGTLKVTGDVSVPGDVKIATDLSVDGTTALQDTVITGDSTFTFDPIAGETGPTFKVLGDWSSRSNNTTYTARTDGFVVARRETGATTVKGYTPSGTLVSVGTPGQNNFDIAITFPVKGGNTWDVSGAESVLWIPLGDNT